MSKTKVSALRSVDLGFADLGKAKRFFTVVWNLAPAGESGDLHYLRGTGAMHHIVTLRYLAKPGLIRITFDATDRATVDAVHAQAIAHGLKSIDPPAGLRQPHGDYGSMDLRPWAIAWAWTASTVARSVASKVMR